MMQLSWFFHAFPCQQLLKNCQSVSLDCCQPKVSSIQLSTINFDHRCDPRLRKRYQFHICLSILPATINRCFSWQSSEKLFGKSLFRCFLWHIHVLRTNMYFGTMYILQLQLQLLLLLLLQLQLQLHTYIHTLYIPIKHLWIYPVNTWVISSFLQHQLIEFRQLTTLLSHGPVPSPLAVSADDARNEWHVHLVLRHLWPP